MTNIVTKTKRSEMMSAISSKDTKLEVWLRSELHRRGFRFRKNYKELAGKPDIYFPKKKAAIFLNGCFWHWHEGCYLGHLPKSNMDFWKEKLEKNRERDRKVKHELEKNSIRCLVVWECALKGKYRRKSEDVLAEIEEWIRFGTGSIDISSLEKL
ncbi:DNA mismatch endonuclease Vsr [Vibrio parahaemolyticus]